MKVKLSVNDLHAISEFNKIVMNYIKMQRLLKAASKGL